MACTNLTSELKWGELGPILEEAAVAIPAYHGRSRAWTLALIVPGLNIVAYWVYAFTLERDDLGLA